MKNDRHYFAIVNSLMIIIMGPIVRVVSRMIVPAPARNHEIVILMTI